MRKRGFVVSATAAVVTAVSLVGVQLSMPGWAGFRRDPKEVVDEVWQIVNREYVDPSFNSVDWEAVRRDLLSREYATREEAYEAIREALKKLNDPYTRFLDPDQFASMQIDTSGELTGVGITLGVDQETNELVVISPIEGSPADRAGIKSKDVIVRIDDKSTEGMDTNTAVSLIRGEPGTRVRLTIRREGEGLKVFDLVRERIELATVRYEARQEKNGLLIGYIRITQFSGNAADKVRQAIRELEKQGVAAYVLDLRANPGGLLYSSAEIARMWIDRGSIVSTVNRQGEQDRLVANNSALTDKPLAVLVDGGSASASEILSGALQDNRRAVIVGTQTFGKGLVQSVHPLSDGSGLAVTIARYRTPKGTDIDHKGITPDIVVELSEEDLERLSKNRELVATAADPQYAAAVRALQSQIAARQQPAPEVVRSSSR
ncbi:carboxyl-terminal processing protease CtpC [Synechococcus sp. H65.1]|uniref:carboxyl-terminal processing protease CtpC n=1 Tax=unclassified Synechococcus TaxID=2626047 RepID=UPI0039C2D9C6